MTAFFAEDKVSIADATLASPQPIQTLFDTFLLNMFQSQTRRLLPRNKTALLKEAEAVAAFQSQTRRLLPRNKRSSAAQKRHGILFQSQTRRLLPRNHINPDSRMLTSEFQSQTRRLLPRNVFRMPDLVIQLEVSIADATLASPQPLQAAPSGSWC